MKNTLYWITEGFFLIAPVLILTSIISIVISGRSFVADVTAVAVGVIFLPWAFAEARTIFDKYTKED